MISLFIDTSDKDVSIGIIKDQKILSKIEECIPNKHSVYTTSNLEKSLTNANLKPEDIDRIYVVNGPGSFTGIRIGVTIAKVYAYLLKKDIIPVSSLKILALSSPKSDYYLSIINAKHDNYYLGLYNNKYEEIIPEKFTNIEELKKIIDKYNPEIVSNNDEYINDIKVSKTSLDMINIIEYYKDYDSLNPHLVNPNYLKLPEALENNK